MVPIGQLKIGQKIIYREVPHEVLVVNHLNFGRGQAKLVTKLRNLFSQATIETTFQGNDRLEEAIISYQKVQFLYQQNGQGFFMTLDTFAQLNCPISPKLRQLLKEGQEVSLQLWRDQVIGIAPPKKIFLQVSYTEPGFQGNTTTSPSKPATLETGAIIQVPLFIKTGDKIIINTETGKYDGRS